VDDTRDITQESKQHVDQKVGAAATLKEDTKRGKEDGACDRSEEVNRAYFW